MTVTTIMTVTTTMATTAASPTPTTATPTHRHSTTDNPQIRHVIRTSTTASTPTIRAIAAITSRTATLTAAATAACRVATRRTRTHLPRWLVSRKPERNLGVLHDRTIFNTTDDTAEICTGVRNVAVCSTTSTSTTIRRHCTTTVTTAVVLTASPPPVWGSCSCFSPSTFYVRRCSKRKRRTHSRRSPPCTICW